MSLEALHVYAMLAAMRCKFRRARDVISAFTSVDLKEFIVIEWPVGVPYIAGNCMRLGKMVDGLKRAAFIFHAKVKANLLSLGFEPTLFDCCLFFQFVYDTDFDIKYLLALALLVDNFNIIAERKEDVIRFDAEVAKLLDTRIKDPSVMLGIV